MVFDSFQFLVLKKYFWVRSNLDKADLQLGDFLLRKHLCDYLIQIPHKYRWCSTNCACVEPPLSTSRSNLLSSILLREAPCTEMNALPFCWILTVWLTLLLLVFTFNILPIIVLNGLKLKKDIIFKNLCCVVDVSLLKSKYAIAGSPTTHCSILLLANLKYWVF